MPPTQRNTYAENVCDYRAIPAPTGMQKKHSKLALGNLHKETIQALAPDQLHRVGGGQLPEGTGWTSLNTRSCITCNCGVSQNGGC
jgi:hypothetical protein